MECLGHPYLSYDVMTSKKFTSYGEQKLLQRCQLCIIIGGNGAKEARDENANREVREILHDLGEEQKDGGDQVAKDKEYPDDEGDIGDDIKNDGAAGEIYS